MNQLFETVERVRSEVTGWCSAQKAQTLAAIVVALRPAIVVEIGVWAGKSLFPMALAMRWNGRGRVYAIDPWSSDASVQGQLNDADREWWSHQSKHDYAFVEFQKWVALLELQDVIVIQRAVSNEVPVPPEIGLLHCDGNHGAQAIEDIERFSNAIGVGGFVVLDDLQWTGGAVGSCMELLVRKGFEMRYRISDPETQNEWAVFQRVKT